MRQYILSSFVSKQGGGNKAAVAIDNFGMNECQMLDLAKRNNFSETAFIDIGKSRKNYFLIRYFTPVEEVDICGHAALASFHLLKQLGYLNEDVAYHGTKAGELKVLIDSGTVLIEMKKPELVMQLSKNEVMETIEICEKEVVADENNMIDVISTGLKDIILEVRSIEALKGLKVKKQNMIDLCRKYGLIGMHVVSRETIEEDSDFCCRNFAPLVGIDEESATGTSNSSMLYYFIKSAADFDYNRIYKVEQGYFMNSPSNIYVKADKETGSIYVGGKAVIESMEEIEI